ncbi:type II/IV secretion system protein [bacterium SCSIO 12741]|nr:type II/IV secretion system protein [bacterium SCSIO 12741]
MDSGLARDYRVIPVGQGDGTLRCCSDLSESELWEELEILLGKSVEVEQVDTDQMEWMLSKYYRKQEGRSAISVSVRNPETFLDDLIGEAKGLNSSDIHIESYEKKCRVRFRIDGHLMEKYAIPKNDYPALINKIKIKSNLDIAEKRLPQDGRIEYDNHGVKFDIRVSVLPTLYGEKVVMRLLNNDATNIDLDTLGMRDLEKDYYREAIRKPSGIVLISGPTGSGKTTTLYATLKLLNKENLNVVTVEDPIEYTLPGINQVQVKESIGLSFASALRSFLRQDPDVIMLGEIRDAETANMAIRAALTGHLVLSTVHTNSAWGTISRLRDMGVPAFLLSGTLNASIAQRLVRKLCPHCKREEAFDLKKFPLAYKPPRILQHIHQPVGCIHCHHSGYQGRLALYEIIPVYRELVESIKNNENNISDYLLKWKIKSLSDNAFDALESGITSLDEVYPYLTHNH